jgi:hypothetical protein
LQDLPIGFLVLSLHLVQQDRIQLEQQDIVVQLLICFWHIQEVLERSNHCKYVGGKLTPKTDYHLAVTLTMNKIIKVFRRRYSNE